MRAPERDLGEVIARMAEHIAALEARCRELEAALAAGHALVERLLAMRQDARAEHAGDAGPRS